MKGNTYTMRHVEVTLPTVTNDGVPSYYPERFADYLDPKQFTGWTEYEAEGMWNRTRETVRVFTFYLPIDGWRIKLHELGVTARYVAEDQEAIQVVDRGEVTLIEY